MATLPYGAHDPSTLPQFRTGLRIVKQLSATGGETDSWYGGRPRMPADEPWPTDAEGLPLVFVAQLSCPDFPADLWGGAGPRTGWFVIFVGGRFVDGALPGRVLHVDALGPERESPADLAADWIRPGEGGRLSQEEDPFPRWPVVLVAHPEGAPETARPYRRDTSDRPSPWGTGWPGGDAGHPLTVRGVRLLFDGLRRWLEQEAEHGRRHAERLRSTLARGGTPGPGDDADHVAREHDVATRRQPEIEAALRTLGAAAEALEEIVASWSASDPLSVADWRALHDRLNAIERADIRRDSTGYAPNILGERYFERRFTLERPRRIPQLREGLIGLVREIGSAPKRLRVAMTNRTARRQRHEAKSLSAQRAIPEHEAFQLQHDRETSDEAARRAAEAAAVLDRLVQLRERVAPMNGRGRVTDAIWDEVAAVVADTVLTDFEWAVIRPGSPEHADYTVTRRGLLDPGGRAESSRFLDALVRYRRAVAPLRFTADPASLPEAVRTHFEPQWASAALDTHDGMGGLPRWDAVRTDLLWVPTYYSPDDRARWLRDNPWDGPAEPPFDGDNAVLLQLFTCPLMGWSFGDASHLVLICPRVALDARRFDTIVGIVGG